HLLEQDSATQEFSYYLVARREYFLYEELDTLDKKSDEHRELLRVLQNDGFTREEVTEAYLNNKDRFAGFDTMYDTLVAEDLKFLNDENVQLIDKEQYNKLANQKGYASFKRAFYDEIAGDEKIEVRTFRVGKTKVSSMMKRKGSQKSIISPLFSALTNHAEITKKGLKQTVYNKIGDIAEEMPDLFQRQQLKVFPEMNGSFSYPQEKDSKIIMARKNYKRVPYLVDAQIKRTVDEILTPGNITYFEKMIIGVNRLFTKGTTGLYYGFALSNTTIDQITLAAQTRNKTIPVYDALKSLTKSLNMSNDEHRFFLEYLVSGGDRQTLIGWQNMTPNELTAKINNERNGLLKLVDLIEAGTEILATPSKYSEIATRAAEYINARKAGKPAIVAMEEAGRVTASFHHMGRFGHSQPLKTFIKSVPFFNPGIQVLSQAAETLHTKEGQKRYAFTSLAVLAASVGAMGLIVALGTDDQKDLYADISPEELMKYIWLPNPNGKSLIKVRVPDQLNIIPTLINMMWADKALLAKYKAGEYIDASMAWLPQQIQLNKPVQAFMSLIPQIIKPAFLTVAGVKDYPEIRPLESQYQKSRSPGLRFTEGTSPLAKSIGEKLNISPIKLDYLITGYFGRASGYFTGKPDIYDPFKSMKKEYYFSSGRKVQEFYDRKEVNDNLYYDMQHDLKKFTLREKNDIIKEKKQLKTINDLLKDYNDLDEEKYPKKVETIRNKIINLINKL
ncbi:MAG: LPD38 domain-containing protein, partial [Bacteroidales bacterium]